MCIYFNKSEILKFKFSGVDTLWPWDKALDCLRLHDQYSRERSRNHMPWSPSPARGSKFDLYPNEARNGEF